MKETSPTPPALLSVDEMIDRLTALSQAGFGHKPVGIPFDPGHTTMGGTPTVGITRIDTGFDWDHGKVLMSPSVRLGQPDAELRQRLGKMENEHGMLLLAISRLGDPQSIFSVEEQIRQVQNLANVKPRKAISKSKPTAPLPSAMLLPKKP